MERIGAPGGPFGIFYHPLLQNIKKLKGDPLLKKKHIFRKKSNNAEKTKRGTLWDFSTSIVSQNIKKLKEGPLGKTFFSKKVSQCRKKLKGGPLVSPGIVCYAEKEEKPFWFSSLGQMIQFGTIKISRTPV